MLLKCYIQYARKYGTLSSGHSERLLPQPCAMPVVTSRGEDFHLGTETRLDHWSFLCNRILFKYKREKASDVDIRRSRKNALLLVFSKVFYVCLQAIN